MEIGIIGAGSIGMLIGSYVSEAGIGVRMLVRNETQKMTLNTQGIGRIGIDGAKVTTDVLATTLYEELASVKLIIIAVKYKDLASVLRKLKEVNTKKPLLFIQNGLAHLGDVKEEYFPHIAFATVEHGALKKDANTVMHNGVGSLTIGERFGDARKFDIMEQASCEQFPVIRSSDAAFILLRKALINCLINPLTTILGLKNGELLINSHAHQLMRALYDELMSVFPEMAETLSFSAVESICQRTAANQSSMLADYRAGRMMEIAPIVSAVLNKAKKRGGSLPLLDMYENILFVLDGKASGK